MESTTMRDERAITAAAGVLLAVAMFVGTAAPTVAQKGVFPVIVLASDGTGDYGPTTPGTETGGWQEAINQCVASRRDLYVKGGGTFVVSDTIVCPATQDFRIDGGSYTVLWAGPPDRDLFVFDSGMDYYVNMGTLVYGGTGAAIRFKPTSPVPIDGFAVLIDCEFRVGSIRSGGAIGGTGVLFDASSASIAHAFFHFGNIEGFSTGISTSTSGSFAHNYLKCLDLHTDVAGAVLARLRSHSWQNTVSLTLGVDSGAAGVKGLELSGGNNVVDLTFRGAFASGNLLTFASSASGNQVRLIQGSSLDDPTGLVTDSATNPTNSLRWMGSPAPIRQVNASAGVFTYTQRLYPATARVVGGAVSDVRLRRGSDSVVFGTTRGDVLLSVGDRLQVTSTVAPAIQIIPRMD